VERRRAQHLSALGYIAQRPRLDPNLTGAEYIVLPQRVRGHEPNGEWLDYLADRLEIAPHLGKYASELSGGQAQRVAIMAALAHEPPLVYADEPTSALDVELGAKTFELFHDISEVNGISVLCVTHNPDISAFADRIIYMRDGVVTDMPQVDQAV
jgi:putative ABC transport system ATP-binding protein